MAKSKKTDTNVATASAKAAASTGCNHVPPVKDKTKTKSSMKPGQKYITPLVTDSLSRFYISTYRQKKGKSPMSEKWILEHGLFKIDKATRIDLRNQMAKMAIKEEKKKAK